MEFDFGFRVDLGNNIGSGHFFRCISLAEKLIENGSNVIFLINNKETIENHFNDKKISFHVLISDNENGKIDECKIFAKKISKLIIDLPFNNQLYSESLKNICSTIVIDDLGNKSIISNLLINGSIVKEFQHYSIDQNVTKYLSGPKYLILRTEFEMFRKNVSIETKIEKILLVFGGSDDDNLTQKILPYFFDKDYTITVVIGPSNHQYEKLKELVPKNKKFNLINYSNNIAELFSNQDLVISSSGITSYELASLGIPSIFIPVDKYQIKTASELEKLGFGINYGFWDNDFLNLDKLIIKISDYSIRKNMFSSGRILVDGKGSTRIIKAISKL